jgi:hypothetical protein
MRRAARAAAARGPRARQPRCLAAAPRALPPRAAAAPPPARPYCGSFFRRHRGSLALTQRPLARRRSCIAAPCEADVGVYELVGEVGKKNGEKKLRCAPARALAPLAAIAPHPPPRLGFRAPATSPHARPPRSTLVARTREWNSVEVRRRTAEECCQLNGYAELAEILRSKRCVLLKKVHMLYLARVWNYRSDLWCRRGDRIRGGGGAHGRAGSTTAVAAAAAAMAAAAARAGDGGPAASGNSAGPLHVAAPVQPEAVMAYVAKTLRPLALESSRLVAGRRAAAAASAGGGEAAHLTADTLAELRAMQACFGSAEAAAAGVHAALCDEAHDIAPDAAAAPAWSGLSADAMAAEALVAGLLQLCTGLATATQRRGAAPALAAAEAVWLDELWQAQLLGSECAARAQLVLLRVKAQPRGAFLSSAAVLMEALVTWLSSTRANLARREAWVARLLASRPAVGDSSPPRCAGCGGGDAAAAQHAPQQPPAAAVELPPGLAAVVATYAGGALRAWGAATAACGGAGAGGGACAAGAPTGADACGADGSAGAAAGATHAQQSSGAAAGAGTGATTHAVEHLRDASCTRC